MGLSEMTSARLLVACALCGEPVDAYSRLTYRRVVGWEKPRSAGGTNALALRQPLNTYAHSECIDKARRGIDAKQGVLL